MSFDMERFREFGLTEGEKHFRRLVKAVEHGEQPPAETLQFLADAGRKILAGGNPKKHLKLEKPRGNKKTDGFTVIKRIELVRIACLLMDERGLSKQQALERIAGALSGVKGYSFDSIERYYDSYQRLARETNAAEKIYESLSDPQK